MGVVAATNGNVSVLNTSTSVLAENSNRRSALIVNDSDNTIYLSLSGTAFVNKGIRLNANGSSYEINQKNLYLGAITAISSVTGKNITVVEL